MNEERYNARTIASRTRQRLETTVRDAMRRSKLSNLPNYNSTLTRPYIIQRR